MQNQLLTRDEVAAFFGGLHYSTIYRHIRRGIVPKPIKVGPGSSRWLRSECEAALRRMVEGRGLDEHSH